ncbi:hypothetical protein Tco_0321892 [Tanacetum coccineum]
MSLQEIEDLKQHYLDEMLSLSNDLGIKDYHNEKIDIHFRRECEDMIDEVKGKFNGMSIEINKKIELQRLEQVANLSTYPSQRFKSFCCDDDDDYDCEERSVPLRDSIFELPPSIAITSVLLTLEPEDSLIMEDEELSTIPEKESDEFIKSSVEDLVPIPSESEDTSGSDCDLPSCDDFSPINGSEEKSVTFSNPLFDSNDDFTSSDDESLSDEEVPEDNLEPSFEFDDKYILSDVNPLFDEVLEDIESKDSYVSNLDKPALLVTPLSDNNKDECFDPGGEIDEINDFLVMDISTNIENGYHDSEGDITYLESLLINNTIPNLPPEAFLDHDPRSLMDEPYKDDLKKIPSGESKVHIEVLSVLWGNRLPIPNGSLPLSRYQIFKKGQKQSINGQNRGRDWKSARKAKPKAYTSLMGQPIHQSPRGIFINQAKYAQEILKKHGMTSCDSIGTPMATKHLDADLSGTPVDQTKYRSMVGALMYLSASRPDIVHATCYCARYQAKPTEKHLTAVKQIFRYLKDSINIGGDKLVSWSSKKQDCTSMSSAEAEYVSLSGCCAQVLWLRTQLTDYGFHFDKIPITEYQLADLFTKALSEDRFKYLVRRLGMRCLTPDELEVLAIESA